jgi:hypothetical protein
VGESRVLLQRYADQLSDVIQSIEGAVDHPRIPPRAAAWAHASIYQVCGGVFNHYKYWGQPVFVLAGMGLAMFMGEERG